jgi:tetratricopeptide (TPR) repeat protein
VALLCTSPGKLAEVTLGVPAALGRVARRVAPGVVSSLSRRPTLVERGRRMGSDISYVLTKRYSFARDDVAPSLVEFTAAMNAATPFEVVAEFFPAFDAHDKLAALPVLNGVETLILAGEGDLMTPADHSRGMVAIKQERWQDAWADYDRAVRLQPSSAHALYGRGIAALRLGRAAEGAADLAAAQRLDQAIAETYSRYAVEP